MNIKGLSGLLSSFFVAKATVAKATVAKGSLGEGGIEFDTFCAKKCAMRVKKTVLITLCL